MKRVFFKYTFFVQDNFLLDAKGEDITFLYLSLRSAKPHTYCIINKHGLSDVICETISASVNSSDRL